MVVLVRVAVFDVRAAQVTPVTSAEVAAMTPTARTIIEARFAIVFLLFIVINNILFRCCVLLSLWTLSISFSILFISYNVLSILKVLILESFVYFL